MITAEHMFKLSTIIRTYSTNGSLKRTVLFQLHKDHNAKFFNFNGWEMPLQYTSIKEEHKQCRTNVAMFDVSHMLQTKIYGPDRFEYIEKLVVGDVMELPSNKGILSLITNENGGIEEDLIITNTPDDDSLTLVSNAGNAQKVKILLFETKDRAVREGKHHNVEIVHLDRSLIAVQGPMTTALLESLPNVRKHESYADFYFMNSLATGELLGYKGNFRLTRCGYTGEDGIEISLPNDVAIPVTKELLALNLHHHHQIPATGEKPEKSVQLAGFAARDLLRLESGLCLYGVDMDEKITPVEANLVWTIGKRRLKELNFPGAKSIAQKLAESKNSKLGTSLNKRIGLIMEGKGPLPRMGHMLYSDSSKNKVIGQITSGNFSPTLNCNIAMGYVSRCHSKVGTEVFISPKPKSTERALKMRVAKLPFVPTKYFVRPKLATT